MSDLPQNGLLGQWPGSVAPGGRLLDRSPEANHGIYGPNAKWVWFTNPRAVRHEGKHDRTYVGYLGGPTGRDIVVGTYDHDADEFWETVVASDVSPNDHVGPSVFARNDGHLLVFWSLHDGPWMRYRTSESPEDPDSLGPVQQFDGGSICYPNPVQLGEEPGAPIYLFYRDRAGTGDGHPHYKVSTDGGKIFSEPTRIITAPEGHYSVYWMAAERDGEIHLFFTDAEEGGTGPKWNIAYAEFDDGTLLTADGESIATKSSLPIRVEDLETIYDASPPDAPDPWIWDSGIDADGNPVAVYATFPSTQEHVYRYLRRVDGEWRDRKLVDAGRYVGARPGTGFFASGIAMPEHDPDIVYGAVTRGEKAVLKRFETDDAGETFGVDTVSTRPVADDLRPVVPRRYSPELPVVWTGGAYKGLPESQTVLRGVPGDVATGGPLVGDASHGVSLGIDPYDAITFKRGLTLAVAFETAQPEARQCLVDLGGTVELWIADDDPGTLTLSLQGADDGVSLTRDGVSADTFHLALASWDGETVEFGLDDVSSETTGLAGPLAFDGEREGWTLGKPRFFDGPGVVGSIGGVALYNRSLDVAEREQLDTGLR